MLKEALAENQVLLPSVVTLGKKVKKKQHQELLPMFDMPSKGALGPAHCLCGRYTEDCQWVIHSANSYY